MRQLLCIFGFILFSNFSIAQIDAPYYMAFEEWYDSYFECTLTQDCRFLDWRQEEAVGDRIEILPFDPNYGKSLKIEVRNGDIPSIPAPIDGRTRSEIAMKQGRHNLYIGSTRYYSYDVFIPGDQDFPDDSSGGFYNIMQWHPGSTSSTYCSVPTETGKPPILLEYRMPEGDIAGNTGTTRDLRLTMGTWYGICANQQDECPYDPFSRGKKTFEILDAVEKGQWNHIVFNIKWSHDGDDAYIYININGKHVINANSTPFYNDCTGVKNELKLGGSGDIPFKLTGVPLLYVNKNAPDKYNPTNNDILQMYQKIGHYRKFYTQTNMVYVDNYRITLGFPPAPLRTHLLVGDCGKTLKEPSDFILKAHEIEPSDSYLFQFKDGNNYEYSGGHTTPEVNIINKSWLRAGKTYDVQVRAKNSLNEGNGFSYGKVCQITTPAQTKLTDYYCNNYNISFGTTISCEPIIGATSYEFKINAAGQTHYYTTFNPNLNLVLEPWFDYGITMSAQVRAFTPDVPNGFSFGDVCGFEFNFGFGNNQETQENTLNAILSPNPTSTSTTVLLSENVLIERLELYNSHGEILRQVGNSDEISLFGLQSDIYFLKIHTKKGIIVEKVIKY